MMRRKWLQISAVFVAASLIAGGTVAGPGLSWDEPAYRHSQVTLQSWLRELANAGSPHRVFELFSADAIDVYFEFNRFGHNFHPPMGSYLNLISFGLFGGWIEDICARRLASSFEFAGCAAMLFAFIARRFGVQTGLFAAASLLFTPRVMGNAHLIDTDIPLMFFWSATALAFDAGLRSRGAQWLAGFAFGCLLLVKFSGVVVLGPCMAWLAIHQARAVGVKGAFRWCMQTLLIFAPLIPYAVLFILRPGREVRNFRLIALDSWGLGHPALFWACLLIPALATAAVQLRRIRARQGSQKDDSQRPLEMPWVLLAFGPLVAVLLNPTWWHDPVLTLAGYFNLNLDRQSALPSIGIFYLGRRYFYTLPWHNAPVLMAATIPLGTLLLGTVGCGLGAAGLWRSIRGKALAADSVADSSPAYFLLHAWTLPVFRMLGTPAHDGVRLFLPTFFFWAGLAAMAAHWLAKRFRFSAAKWVLLWIAGPGLAAFDWVRIHPFELSYYNVGLKRAFDWGFEPTYWYDCVTPAALRELNAKLPAGQAIGHVVDPLINSEVFSTLYSLGKIREDIDVNPKPTTVSPWVWMSTHSSKATSYTRLLYSCRAWHSVDKDGVKLFSVLDDRAVDLAWSLWALCVDKDDSSVLGSLQLNELAFQSSRDDLGRAVELLADPKTAKGAAAREPAGVQKLVDHWLRTGRLHPTRQRAFQSMRPAVLRAIDLFDRRREDLRTILSNEGYLSPERFGGWLTCEPEAKAAASASPTSTN